MTEVSSKQISTQIPNHCFDFVKNCLSNMVHLSYMSYDRDDFSPIQEPQLKTQQSMERTSQDEIFFDTTYFGFNHWVEILEPRKTRIDRSASSVIKVNKSIINITTPHLQSSKNNLFVLGDIIDKCESMISTNQNINLSKNEAELISKKEVTSTAFVTKPTVKKNIDFDQWDIEELKNCVEENFILNLREEKKKEIKRKEDEVQIKKNIENNKDVNKNENTRRQREFDGKKYTFDVDGAVLNIRGVAMERLVNNFSQPKFEVKSKKDANNQNNMITDSSNNTMALINKKTNNPPSPVKLDNKGYRTSILVKNNSNNQNANNRNIYNNTKDDKYIMNQNAGNYDRITVQPAGSNFDLIFPEIGVTIIEGIRKKGGEKDFFKKYQKYSKYDYTNLQKESAPINNNRLANSMNIEDITHIQLSLPLLNISDNNNSFAAGFNKKINPMKLSTSTNTSMGNKLSSSINLMESMKISNKLKMSLKSTLDNLDFIPEFEEKMWEDEEHMQNLGGSIISQMNIRRDDKKEEIEKQNASLDAINKFNFSIIQNTQWGSNSSLIEGSNKEKKEASKKYKPDKRELEREVGTNVANVKLPRSRIFTLNKSKNIR